MMLFLAALAGGLVGLGLVLGVAGWMGAELPTISLQPITRRLDRDTVVKGAIMAAAALIVWFGTHWLVMSLAAAFVVWLWPTIRATYTAEKRQITRLEALATWTESLRDTIAGASGLPQAIALSAETAHPEIRPQLQRLMGQVRAQVPLPAALAQLGADLADPDADETIAALVLSSRLQSAGLQASLSELASITRAKLDMRVKIDEDRRTNRSSALVILGIIVAIATAMAFFSGGFLAAYASPLGQLWLTMVLGIWTAAFIGIKRSTSGVRSPRFLGNVEKLAGER